jgi:putative ABC transport system permease protein
MKLAIDIREAFDMALAAMGADKGRSALTSLGIIIGITAVLTTMTAANGLQNTFKQSFAEAGADVIYVSKMPWLVLGTGVDYRNRPEIDLAAADALARQLTGRAVIVPSISAEQDVKFRSIALSDVTVIGTTDQEALISTALPDRGRFLLRSDVRGKRNVAVIGSRVAATLFPAGRAVGAEILIGRNYFRVIGVMEKRGDNFFDGPDYDQQIYIPITTFERIIGPLGGQARVDIGVKAPPGASLADVEDEVTGAMRRLRHLRPGQDDDFTLNKLDTLLQTFDETLGVVLLLGLAVTSISLFVGGVGVMNIMFVSVTERTREIGIRKAIGARRRSLLLQFLFESSIICLFGGAIGIFLATLITQGIALFLMPASLSPATLLAAPLISIAVGVVSGLVPALRGARLPPIEALRYE